MHLQHQTFTKTHPRLQESFAAPYKIATDNRMWEIGQQILAWGALLALTPLFMLLYIAVKTTSKGPFLYSQQRPGRGDTLFRAYKIRSMRTGADKDKSRGLQVAHNDPMITPIGHLLRNSKLDELPQLYNVARGDMALVGPRPIAPNLQAKLERAIPGFRIRLNVRPGITSLAQVCILESGTSTDVIADWQRRFRAERHYLRHKSVVYDLLIIALTGLFLIRKVASPLVQRLISVLKHSSVLILCCIGLSLLGGCTDSLSTQPFDTQPDGAYSRAIEAYGQGYGGSALTIEPVRATPLDLSTTEAQDYRIGVGDRLRVNIFGEPGMESLRLQVDAQGYIQLPFLDAVSVLGKTTLETQQELKTGYSAIFKSPWIVVDIAEYRSRPINLLGQFNSPGVYFLDGPTDLLRGISFASGLSENAHLRGARLWRNSEVLPVDIFALLEEGRTSYNLPLQAGDTIYVPSIRAQQAYVLGAVEKPGAVVFSKQQMTLLKALSEAGGFIKQRALLSQVRIIRTISAVEGELILANVSMILKGKAPDISLYPDDVIYIPQNVFANWNDALSAITPSLQAVGGVLQPFVQIKFLKGSR